MYSLSDSYKKVFADYAAQHVKITVDFSNTANNSVDGITIDESEIMQGTLTIDRSSMSGNTMEVGSAIAAELNFTLNNSDGHFSKYNFEGAELDVEVYVYDGNGTKITCPMGHFVIDTQPRRRSTIEISALDNMRKFDQLIDRTGNKFYDGMTLYNVVAQCCDDVGVTLADNTLSSLANNNQSVLCFPDDEDLTYRELLQNACALMGVNAYSDWNGRLQFGWYYSDNSSVAITKSNRYDGADIEESDITITGIAIEPPDGDTGTVTAGNAGYMIEIDNNIFLKSKAIYDNEGNQTDRVYPDYSTFANNLYNNAGIKGMNYRPFSCSTKPMPWLWPMDRVIYTDPDGNDVNTYVTHMTFYLNAHTDVEAEGNTTVDSTYYVSSRTSVQSKILTEIENTNTRLNEQVDALLRMNEAMMSGMGMYTSVDKDENGASIYYFHDQKELSDSTVVFCFKSSGFMWTDDYQSILNGTGAWKYGFTAEGDSVFQFLEVTGLRAKWVETGTLTANDSIIGSRTDLGTKDSLGREEYDEPTGVRTTVGTQGPTVEISHGASGRSDYGTFTVTNNNRGKTTDVGRLLYDNTVKYSEDTYFMVYQSETPPSSVDDFNERGARVNINTIKLGGFYFHAACLRTEIAADAWITYRNSDTCIANWWQGASPSTLDGYLLSNGQGSYIYTNAAFSTYNIASGYPMWQVDEDSAQPGSRFYWIDQSPEGCED